MDAMTWQSLGEILAVVAIGGYTAVKARRADRQTRFTGNGFADEVTSKLNKLTEKVARIERKMDAHHSDTRRHRRWFT